MLFENRFRGLCWLAGAMMSFDVFFAQPSETDDVFFKCRNELT
jgi:hypothetical protein